MTAPLRLPVVAVAFLFIVGAVYAGTLHSPFVYDDVVIKDSSLLHISRLSQLRDIALATGVPRKVGLMSFALNFYAGGLDPRGYHVVNVGVHVLNGIVLYLLALTILRVHFGRQEAPTELAIPVFLGTALWLVHPVETQAVAYVWQRVTSLASLFVLSSLYAYVEARLRKPSATTYALYAAALLLGLLAIGTKENAATLPLFVVLIELLFLRRGRAAALFEGRTLVVTLGLVFFFLGVAIQFLGPRFVDMMQNEFQRRGFTLTERLLTELRVVVYYLSLLSFPHPSRLMVDYDLPLSRSLFSPPATFGALLVVTCLLALAVDQWRPRPLLSFVIFWYFGHLVVESSVIPLDLVYEHRLYLPSMAPLVAAMALAVWWVQKRSNRAMAVVLALVPIGIASAWSKERSRVWEDPVALWSDNAIKAPGKARVHGNLGKAYLDRGDYLRAQEAFEKALALEPTLVGAQYNLAVISLDYVHDNDRARSILDDLLARDPSYVPARVSKGVLHLRAHELKEARAELERALADEPTNPVALFNLGGVYFNANEMERAIEILRRGVALWPADPRMHALLGAAYLETGALSNARAALRKSLDLDRQNEMARLYWEKLQSNRAP